MLRGLAAVGIGAAGGAAAHGFAYERHHVHLTTATLNVQGLPAALAGLRVGFLSDLHRSAMVPHDLVKNAARLLMAQRPDLVVLGGDYVTAADRRFVEPAAEALADLSAPHGVFGVLGNHDDDRDMPPALAARGVVVLRDARTRVTVRHEPMDLIGIRYWTRRPADIARLCKGLSPASILIAHTPARLIEAAELSMPLVLSGHTHGGQVVLPGLGPIAARRFPVVAGQARRQRTTIYVTRGVGTVYVPIRVGCPPEVAVLTLQPDRSGLGARDSGLGGPLDRDRPPC
jgi:predicted MPP superfamily phosphohydrolase